MKKLLLIISVLFLLVSCDQGSGDPKSPIDPSDVELPPYYGTWSNYFGSITFRIYTATIVNEYDQEVDGFIRDIDSDTIGFDAYEIYDPLTGYQDVNKPEQYIHWSLSNNNTTLTTTINGEVNVFTKE